MCRVRETEVIKRKIYPARSELDERPQDAGFRAQNEEAERISQKGVGDSADPKVDSTQGSTHPTKEDSE